MAKKEPWRASSMLVRANIEHMHPEVKKHLENYAKGKGITLEEATKRAVEIVRKLEYHTTQKVAKGEIAPVVTILGAKPPVLYTHRVVSSQLYDGGFPDREEKFLKGITSREKEEFKQLKEKSVKDAGERASRGHTLGGVANPGTRTTSYTQEVFQGVVKKVLDGKTPDKLRVGVIVHETMETLGLLPGEIHEELSPTEVQVADSLMSDIHNLFSEYGVPRNPE